MYSNYLNIDFKNHCNIFAKEAFSRREAYIWLLSNAKQEHPQTSVKASLRILGQEWQWPKTKVARFLKDLTRVKLIEIENDVSSTTIKFIKNNNHKIISSNFSSINKDLFFETKIETETGTVNCTTQYQENQRVEGNAGTETGTLNGTDNKKIAFVASQIDQFGQKWDSSGPENGTTQSKTEYRLQDNSETVNGTIAGQYRDSNIVTEIEKKEKKKRSKKRKEQKYPKEKYSLKGIQKERYENFYSNQESGHQNLKTLLIERDSSPPDLKSNEFTLSKKTRKTMEQVTVNDVASWAENNLPTEINLEWELAKFQDYYRASCKNLPKDGVAAFRNWLRKATEFKNLKAGENTNEKRNTYRSELWASRLRESTGFERFLTGGIRAVS